MHEQSQVSIFAVFGFHELVLSSCVPGPVQYELIFLNRYRSRFCLCFGYTGKVRCFWSEFGLCQPKSSSNRILSQSFRKSLNLNYSSCKFFF